MDPREALQRTLHELIPLSRAMDIRVDELRDETLTLSAPLAANHNHAGSGFAGSIYALASLAGWAILRTLVERHQLPAALVLGTGTIRYHRPLQQDLRASVRLPAAEQARIVERLRAGRPAAVELEIQLPSEDSPCATFSGTYFAKPAQ